MKPEDVKFIQSRFFQVFNVFQTRTIEEMWDIVGDEIVSDVEETASADWTSGDVDIAIERAVSGIFERASHILV